MIISSTEVSYRLPCRQAPAQRVSKGRNTRVHTSEAKYQQQPPWRHRLGWSRHAALQHEKGKGGREWVEIKGQTEKSICLI